MSNITLSAGVRQSLSAIQSTASAQQAQQLKLATGKRVNSAIDNPVNFFTASGLNNRARDLNSLLDSIGQATKIVEAADKGIKALTKLVESAQGSARQALQSASTTAKVKGENATAFTSSSSLNGAGTPNFANADTITIAINGGAATVGYTADGTDTIQDVINGINSNATLNPAGSPQKIQASLNSSGQLVVEALDGSSIAVSGSASAKVSTLFGGATLTQTGTTNTTRRDLAAQFDALRTQIDQLAADSGYSGVNLLDGSSLKVQFNETNTASVTITGVKFNSAGLGIAATGNNLQSDKDINDSLTNLTNGLTKLRNQASTFGSNLSVVQARQDFTQSLIETLETGADSLVLADQNVEAAKLVTLNTRQQLASTALSLATQSEQSVLRLF
ncbi:flagellin [Rhabdaerophilaceae bacterium]